MKDRRRGRRYLAMILVLILLSGGNMAAPAAVCASGHEPDAAEEIKGETEIETDEEEDCDTEHFPEWALESALNDAGNTVTDENGVYYFREELTVSFRMEGKGCVIKRDGTELIQNDELYIDRLYESGAYVYVIESENGCIGPEPVIITAEQVCEAPVLSVRYEAEPAEVNGKLYFREDPGVVLHAEAAAGIARTEYRISEETYHVLEDFSGAEDCRYGENTVYETALREQEAFSDMLAEIQEGDYQWTFRVTDVLGQVTEEDIRFAVDRTAPDVGVFVAYHTDGTNPNVSADTGIRKLAALVMDRLFGREKVEFDLYVKDGTGSGQDGSEASGIDLEDLKTQIITADGKAAVQGLQAAKDGLVSFNYDGILYEGYTHLKGNVTAFSDSSQNTEERLRILRLKDRAGNITEEIDTEPLTGTTILHFDRISPVLSVDYGDGIVDESCGTVFYREEAEVGLAVTEEAYKMQVKGDGTLVLPLIGTGDLHEPEVFMEEWSMETDRMCTKLVFPPPVPEGETEYTFTVEYQDGSGNLLETDQDCPGSVSGGIYTGCPIVVDNRAPELTGFSIDGVSGGSVDGMTVYKNMEGDDVVVSFTIDDHPSYWNPDNVKLVIVNKETGKQAAAVDGGKIRWDTKGRSHHGTWGFDGESQEGTFLYEVRISCEDRAGNRMTGVSGSGLKVMDGVYQSETFLLDHEAPEFHLTLPKAVRLVRDEDTDPSGDLMETVPQTGYTAYYRDTVQVCFSVREYCMEPVCEGTGITGPGNFQLSVTGDSGMYEEPAVRWERHGDRYEGSFFLTGEDRYRISMSCRDLAGNGMVSGQADGSRWEDAVSEEGRYESVLLVVDRTAPVIRTSWVDVSKQERNADQSFEGDQSVYFSEPVFLKLEVEDRNLRIHELAEILKAVRISDRAGNQVTDDCIWQFLAGLDRAKTGSGNFVFYLPFQAEAIYELPAGCEDLAGNAASAGTEKIVVDRTNPELLLSCSVEPSGFLDAVRYRDIRYFFSDSRMTVKVLAKDGVSGIHMFRCMIREEDGTITEKTEVCEPAGSREYEFCVPARASDFKGTVRMEVWDWSGNHTVQEQGHIAESAEKHADAGMVRLETNTKPGRVVGDTAYYNTDVVLRLTVEDSYSGLRKLSCTGGKTIDYSRDYAEEAKNAAEGDRKDGILCGYTEELILKAADNNANEVPVRVEYEDNAGHRGMLEQMYYIDITPPEVTVEYDSHEASEAGLYNRSRTAVVTVRERNFDPSDVEFLIASTGGNIPEIGAWEASGTGDETLHRCQVVFQEDDDYTFTLAFTDLAGNRAEYSRVDAFTIDQTAPVLTVNYDHDRSSNQIYYAQSRTAVIDILEHNFDASLIRIMAEEEEGEAVPLVSGWSEDGDHHRASVVFGEDGAYTFSITGMDLAENEMESYDTVRFVIDRTAPELVILGVEHQSANNGTVAPRIRCADQNYGSGHMEIRLEGYANGILEPEGTWIRGAAEEELALEDFVYEPEADDLYRLVVSACDLAGNESREEVMFSVNRFGSVYTLEDKTELLAGNRGYYYTNEEQDIIVTETNVDLLEAQEITCSLNGTLRTLQEGTDYQVDRSGTETSWKQYTYTIPKRNFEKEGTYVLTLYSEDRAENVSDNRTRGTQIEFAVDKTSPSILLSGLEEGGMYREHSREVTLDIQDNVKTAEVKVAVNGVESTYLASEVAERNGRITLTAGSDRRWQSIHVTAWDAAGNRQDLERKRFLITPDLMVQFFRNRILFYSSMGAAAVLWAAVWQFFFRRRRIGGQRPK